MGGPFRPARDPVCTVDGCEGTHAAWGLCWRHYRRALKHGQVEPSSVQESPLCALGGCDRPCAVLGMCVDHANPAWDSSRAKTSKPRSRYRRRGERSKAARADRAAYDRRRRRVLAEVAQDALGPRGRQELVLRAQAGQGFRETCEEMWVTPVSVWQRARLLPAWGRELDVALMGARDPRLPHGSEYTYRRNGCRCPECREAKRRVGQPAKFSIWIT